MLTAYGDVIKLIKRPVSISHVDEFFDKPLVNMEIAIIESIKQLLISYIESKDLALG